MATGLAAARPAHAQADDEDAAIEEATNLNRKALEEYDNLNFDAARNILEEALQLCSKRGLNNHPIKARTHLHLAVVIMAGGPSRHDEAIRQFRKALAIQPDIKPTSRIANPEVQSAFNEAKRGLGAGPSGAASSDARSARSRSDAAAAAAGGTEKTSPPAATQPPPPTPEAQAAQSAPGSSREASPPAKTQATPNSSTGGPTEAGPGTRGATVAEAKVGKPEEEEEGGTEEEDETEAPQKSSWYLALGVGTGLGWTSGNGDINSQTKVTSKFGSSWLGHALPEVGYFVSRDVILSLQLRLQLVSGATSERDPSGTTCGSDHVCDPARGAFAALARITWLLGQGKLVPYLSAEAGGGQIRHLATFPNSVNNANCGSNPTHAMMCVDTVTAGPILLGPGAGVLLRATPGFGLTLGINSLVGFPDFTVHFDLNVGAAVEL